MNRQVTDLLSGSNPVAQGQCHEIHQPTISLVSMYMYVHKSGLTRDSYLLSHREDMLRK